MFFSQCHKSYSRIDSFLIASPLINSVIDIRTISIVDNAAAELCINAKLDMDRRARWRINTSLLQEKSFRASLSEDLNSFYELNIGSTEDITTVWEASKAYISTHASGGPTHL